MPGDRQPERTPVIGRGGWFWIAALVALLLFNAFGWMLP